MGNLSLSYLTSSPYSAEGHIDNDVVPPGNKLLFQPVSTKLLRHHVRRANFHSIQNIYSSMAALSTAFVVRALTVINSLA